MATKIEKMLGKIHQGDCIAGLKKVPDESVHLTFADPPFNIGYDYDEYDDRLESQKYVEWSHQWMQEVHRVVRPDGSFWLAIGDEYAAELKVEAQKVGFHTRNWVVWYYTFGVHCKTKFTRSHAHLFYFVKDPKQFTFNTSAIAVPSARQLVYADTRANPAGRTPDDTWVLRPQDCVDGFTPDEDMWYFPRVAGTFKERAGFHGCQMPEQLLGRIIKACSNSGDVVLDPFSGSSTTLTVAKKLGREFFGFELSQEYAKLGRKRIAAACVGDSLEGAEEPKISAPATGAAKKSKAKKANRKAQPTLPFASPELDYSEMQSEPEAIIQAYAKSCRGFSVDRLVTDPILHEDFQTHCDRLSVPGTAAERNRFLFRLRKSGRLKNAGLQTTERTSIEWQQMEPFLFAAEIAWRQISEIYAKASLDEIFCDPRLADSFDKIAGAFSPGYSPLEYRWAALKLRKEGSKGKHRATQTSAKKLGIRKFTDADATPLHKIDFQTVNQAPGVYALRDASGNYLYAGETGDLRSRLDAQFSEASRLGWPGNLGDHQLLELIIFPVASIIDARLARQSRLLHWYRPQWNHNDQLAS